MGPLRRPLSIRAGVVLQLALVATASLALLAVFALKVIEVTLQRRHVEAGISVAGVVRRAVEKEIAANPGSPNIFSGMFPGSLSPYINEVVLLPEPPPDGRPKVVPVGEKAFPFLPVYPTVDVILPFGPLSPPAAPVAASVPRGIRVRFHSPGIAAEARTFVNVTLLLAAIGLYGVLAHHVEHRLHEGLQIVRPHEDPGLLAQPRRARPLIRERRRRDGQVGPPAPVLCRWECDL